MTTSVDSPRRATAFVNLHSPVVAVGRNCERIRELRGCVITPNSIPTRNIRIIFFSPQFPYLAFVTRRQAGSVLADAAFIRRELER